MKVKLKVGLSRAMWVCPPSSPQGLVVDHMRSIAVWPHRLGAHWSSPILRRWVTRFARGGCDCCSNGSGSSAGSCRLPGFLDDACDEGPEFDSGHPLLFARLCLLADFLLNGSGHGLVKLGLL